MNSHAFETFSRQAGAALTRRASLLTLGGAALAATVTHPSTSKASGSTFKNKLKKRCQRNKTHCINSVHDFCSGNELCVGSVTPCCDECFSDEFFVCFLTKE